MLWGSWEHSSTSCLQATKDAALREQDLHAQISGLRLLHDEEERRSDKMSQQLEELQQQMGWMGKVHARPPVPHYLASLVDCMTTG